MQRRFAKLVRRAAVGAGLVITALAVTSARVTAEPKPPASERSPRAPTEKTVLNDDGFARALFAKLAAGEGNVVVSPASVEAAVLLALAGARGDTAAQIAQTLQIADRAGIDVGKLLDRYRGQTARAPEAGKPEGGLVIANSAWVQAGLPIHDAYRKLLEAHGRATFELVDFAKKTEAARQAINAWVDGATRHKIKELLPPGALDDSARLVLANAIYFKGQWVKPFDKEATTNQPFRRPGAADLSVPLMHKDSRFRYLETASYQVLELPYRQDGMSMVVWLPRQADTLPALEREIAGANVAQSLATLAPASVEVFLPKFKIDARTSLAETLAALGMKDAFTPRADFSGITDERLMISAVVHQALVDVNEEGTEAAAATAAIAVATAALPEAVDKKIFRADHPFVFAIRNTITGDVLFIGRVVEPGKSGE